MNSKQTINTPEELYQTIGKFSQSSYSNETLIEMYKNSLKCAIAFRGIYSDLPVVPVPRQEEHLHSLQDIMDWSKEASQIVNDIVFTLEQKKINKVLRLFKKLKDFADKINFLVDNKIKEQAQNEARSKLEKEYKSLDKAALETNGMLLIQQTEAIRNLVLQKHKILTCEKKDALEIYLSKDPTFEDRLPQLCEKSNSIRDEINKLIDNTSFGRLLDIYCKLKQIPLEQQFNDIGYYFQNLDDVILNNCNCLYKSIDNVIKLFEGIQTTAKLKTNNTNLQKKKTSFSEETRTDKYIKYIKNQPVLSIIIVIVIVILAICGAFEKGIDILKAIQNYNR